MNCKADKPKDAKFYDGSLGYEAIVCRKCGTFADHNGWHPADEWSKHFVNIHTDIVLPNPNQLLTHREILRDALQFALTIIDRLSEDYASVANKHANYTQGEDKKLKAALSSTIDNNETPIVNHDQTQN
jgi:hypothetical protein